MSNQLTIDVTLLGTGTSAGIPFLNCDCETCTSQDPHDRKYRCCAVLKISNGHNLLIDCGTDIRKCLIRENITHIEGILISHCHADHVHGLPDLVKFYKGTPIPIFCNDICASQLIEKFESLVEGENKKFNITVPVEPFSICDVTFTSIPIDHGKLKIYGYRFGNATYITDCSHVPNDSYDIIKGTEILVLNTLMDTPHTTHLSHPQTLEEIRKIQPKIAYLIHVTHKHNHNWIQNYFDENKLNYPETKDIQITIGYDGLKLEKVIV